MSSSEVTSDDFGSTTGHQQHGYKLKKEIHYSDTNTGTDIAPSPAFPIHLPLIYGNKKIRNILIPTSPFPRQFP